MAIPLSVATSSVGETDSVFAGSCAEDGGAEDGGIGVMAAGVPAYGQTLPQRLGFREEHSAWLHYPACLR